MAAVLMLAQRSIKRLLVLSSIEDFGFLLLGIASIRSLGQDGVLLAAASHALGKSLLFIAIAAPERDGALARGDTGLAGRYPLSAFGFLMGMLTLLGVPPMLGFAGRWKLYQLALAYIPHCWSASCSHRCWLLLHMSLRSQSSGGGGARRTTTGE